MKDCNGRVLKFNDVVVTTGAKPDSIWLSSMDEGELMLFQIDGDYKWLLDGDDIMAQDDLESKEILYIGRV